MGVADVPKTQVGAESSNCTNRRDRSRTAKLMKFNGTIIGIGILAGLASALMSSGVIVQGGAVAAMAMVLYFLPPLRVFVVALGWGSSAGIVAAAAATVAVGGVAAPLAALLMALTSFIPAAT